MQCLLIEDDPDDQEIFLICLEEIRPDVECVVMNNGVDALRKFQTEKTFKPDVIFLDVNMPVLDGLGFLAVFEQLSREYKKRCRIAVISSIDNENEKNRALKYECVIGYFEKPLKEEVLLQLIEYRRLHPGASRLLSQPGLGDIATVFDDVQ